MTSSESRSYSVAALLLLLVSAVRYGVELRAVPGPAWDSTDVLPQLLHDSREREAEEARRTTPLARGETVDPNRADEETLDRLPGVGPSVARAIVEEREAAGGFESPEDLLRVRGIGPATLERIRDRLDLGRGVPRQRVTRPRAGGSPGRPGPGSDAVPRAAGRVDVNRADSLELRTLPGVGPALARRIVRQREDSGAFRSVDDLTRVRGIGAATVERLRPWVQVGRGRPP